MPSAPQQGCHLSVMQVDPTLSRSVLVSTKFDTRIPQFATGADAHAFMHPAAAQLMNARMLGGQPFFTSVPSGRVGSAKDSVFLRCGSALCVQQHAHANPHRVPCLLQHLLGS